MAEYPRAINFKAQLDKMPGADNALTVDGTVEASSAAWTGKLVEAVPQGINPAILILVVEMTPSESPGIQIPSPITLDRFKKLDAARYSGVTIMGVSEEPLSVEISVVH